MNRLYIFLFFIPIIIMGCKSGDIDDKTITQSINSLNMNIYSNEGIKLLSIISPYSDFIKEKNIFNLKKTTIKLYKENKVEYVITSNDSKLSNNNKLIELYGNVEVKTLHKDDDELYSDSFTWNIDNFEFILIGNVKFINNSITLRSNKAILNKKNNIIEFFNPVKYEVKDSNKDSGYEVNSQNAYYNIETKSVSFSSNEKRVRTKIYF